MTETPGHKKYMKRYRKARDEQKHLRARLSALDSLIEAGANPNSTLLRIQQIKHGAEWVRSGRLLEQYPDLNLLSAKEALLALEIGTGQLPFPSRWTPKLFNLIVKGWGMPAESQLEDLPSEAVKTYITDVVRSLLQSDRIGSTKT